jgi:hypothetical protein
MIGDTFLDLTKCGSLRCIALRLSRCYAGWLQLSAALVGTFNLRLQRKFCSFLVTGEHRS